MRILIAIGVSRQREAGAAAVVLNHAQELERRGHRVECWFLEDIFQRPPRWKRFQELSFAIATAKKIVQDPKKFDVANVHAPWGCAYGIWRKLFRPSGAPPYAMTMQGSEERYTRAMRLEERKGRAWNFGWKNRLWHRIYHQTMYDCAIRTADYGAVANREAWICAELKYGRKPGVIWFVPNGTEERFFIPREYPEKPWCNLLYVGTWLDRKGVYYLAESFSLAVKRMPELRLTVAGTSLSEGDVKKYFAASIRDRITVIPFIKREDICDLYAGQDIFVFPSLVEGMPLTLLEAMATGMPVVTTNTCGMADIVEDQVNGLLVPPADAERLAKALEQLCQSAQLRRRLGQAGQDTMRLYTWQRVTQKLETILKLAAQETGC